MSDQKKQKESNNQKPENLGFGLGLRPQHYHEILEGERSVSQAIDWFEIISENYMVPGGKPLYMLDQFIERYPLVMHGVSLSIGSTAPLDMEYLKELQRLEKRVQPKWVSDHICWTGVHGKNMHDLLPIPYTEEALEHIVSRINQVQDFLGRPLVLENASTYVTFKCSEMTEWDFVAALVARTNCLLLCDINNIYVSSFNHGFDPMDYLRAMPKEAIVQIHLAGHTNNETHIIDTHDHPVVDEVWDLYAQAIKLIGGVSTMIERDDNIPPLAELVAELNQARQLSQTVLGAGL